jgi:hypothetical protein
VTISHSSQFPSARRSPCIFLHPSRSRHLKSFVSHLVRSSLQQQYIDPSSIDKASTRSITMGNSFEESPLNRATQPSATPTLRESPSFESETQEHLSTTSPTSPSHEFDPCAIAKPCSPFYLYKHDASRPSTEQSHLKVPGSAIHVSVQDLEAGNLTPTVTQEKRKRSGEYFVRQAFLSWKQGDWSSRPLSPRSSRPSSWIQADYRS